MWLGFSVSNLVTELGPFSWFTPVYQLWNNNVILKYASEGDKRIDNITEESFILVPSLYTVVKATEIQIRQLRI